jgi:hypothetical protein
MCVTENQIKVQEHFAGFEKIVLRKIINCNDKLYSTPKKSVVAKEKTELEIYFRTTGMNCKKTKSVLRRSISFCVDKLQIRIYKVSNTQQKLIYKLGIRNMKNNKKLFILQATCFGLF